ncbi:MAG: DUF3143 domain-containing protein, partial [Coleofasciculaceae cyanobacterium SM2_3_26]|nr:DUF3143 domain-containing protein [Coleofasciculaceae cyanobacterium SM2_3_26]
MTLPSAETPLYNHPLPQIESWLRDKGCQQDREQLHCWYVERRNWQAELELDIEEINVRYINGEGNQDVYRSFKYSLSRQDAEDAIFPDPEQFLRPPTAGKRKPRLAGQVFPKRRLRCWY